MEGTKLMEVNLNDIQGWDEHVKRRFLKKLKSHPTSLKAVLLDSHLQLEHRYSTHIYI